jgi:hypothetical protein
MENLKDDLMVFWSGELMDVPMAAWLVDLLAVDWAGQRALKWAGWLAEQ